MLSVFKYRLPSPLPPSFPKDVIGPALFYELWPNYPKSEIDPNGCKYLTNYH